MKPRRQSVPGRVLRVLVAEDNPTNQKLVLAMLDQEGHEVTVVANGRLAVEQAASAQFDIILMDVQMPGIDGLEAARRIRAAGGVNGRTPIIALTANVLSHQRAEYLAAGMDGVVGKPIAPALLITEIGRLCAVGPSSGQEEAAA